MENEFLRELADCMDESRFPAELTQRCELMECFSHSEGCETLLVMDRESGALYVAKCYEAAHPMFSETEPDAIRSLRHPGLPRFVGEYKSDAMRCVLREYVAGEPLSALPVPMDGDAVRAVGEQLCHILIYLHGQNPPVIHRDIKPENVILSADGMVSLIDFGIFRVFTKQARADTMAFGIHEFSPPEQYGFSQTDCRSDIFSLGVLLHYLLTGNTNRERVGSLPLEKVAAKCMAFDPKNRYADAGAVLRALRRTQPARRRVRIWAWSLAAAVLLVCAVAAGVWWKNYQPMNDPGHTPAYQTSREIQREAADYLNQRFDTTLFEDGEAAGDVGYIRDLLVNVFGYDRDYAYGMPAADPPMEVPESFLPWAFEDDESLSREVAVYIVVKVFWPQVVGDWSSLKNDTGEYPGVRVSVPFAEKKGVLEGLYRPDHLTRGDLAVLFANAARAYGDALPPELAASQKLSGAGERSEAGFIEPLMEQAVRAMLGKGDGDPITREELAAVTELYLVADRVLTSSQEFYAAISDWYAAGRSTRGDVRTLADVALLPNLETVCVVAQELKDITALAQLPKLKKVEFKHNSILNIAVLGLHPDLVAVGLNDNPVEDLSPLAACHELRFLDLCAVQGYDPAFLDELGDFESLDISNSTESYLHLSGKSIRELKLCWSGVTTLDCLAEVDGIETLELNNTAITDLSALASHPTLKNLRISGLAVDDLSVLLKLPELEYVTVSRDMQPAVEALGLIPFMIRYE